MFLVLHPEVKENRLWLPPYISFTTLFLIFCLYGLWNMRRWSVWGLAAYLVVYTLVTWILKQDIILLALPSALVLFSILYYRRME